MTERISRNAECPCGSGKKYKHCCISKDYQYEEDASGTIRRSVPMSPELGDVLRKHVDKLKDDLERPLDDDDQLFPGLHFEHVEHELSQAMQQADTDPAFIYAFEQTGLLVTEANENLISDVDRRRWDDAVAEYRAKHGITDELEFPIGTIALYGPDNKTTTKIVASVISQPDAEPIMERFVGSKVQSDPDIQAAIKDFFVLHGVNRIVAVDENMGCPHEEGEDFPLGGDCPFCPYWQGKQGSGADDSF